MKEDTEKRFIPLSVPNLHGNEIQYVTEALESQWVSADGAMVNEFEKNIAQYVNAKGAVACQSGTAGLHLALYYYQIGMEDMVIVPTLTFIAAVNPVKYLNASPIFMDCDDSLCMDPIKLEKFLQEECDYTENIGVVYKKNLKRVKAILIVHVFGNMADMEKIMKIAKRYHLVVIEDATEALGTYYTKGKYIGKYAGTIGDIGVYSFNGNKIITTGGGGMIVSNDEYTLAKIKYYSTQAKDDTIHFIHNEMGFNYRMTTVQAAIGVAQLEQLEEFIEIKRNNYLEYKKNLDTSKYCILDYRNNIRPNYWFYSLYIKTERYRKEDCIQYLMQRGIQTRPIWGLISEQLFYQNELQYDIQKAKKYYQSVINIPCSSSLALEDVRVVAREIEKFFYDI